MASYEPYLDNDSVQPANFNAELLKPEPAEVTEASLRADLAAAIANHAEAERAQSGAASLADNLWLRRAQARADIDAAQAAIQDIKDRIVVGGTGKVPSLSAARDRLEAAELVLSALIDAEPRLKDELGAAQQCLMRCKVRLDGKVCEVVKASAGVRRIIEDFRVTRATFVEKFQLMRALARASMLPPEAGHWEVSVESEGFVNAPLPEPWRGAVQALRSNADAALPD